MNCHECARRSNHTPAIGLCRSCLVALCKDHLVESHQTGVVPQYGCDHRPERSFAIPREVGRRVTVKPAVQGA
jgi:hypothetical protein